ncbi:MAG: 5-(carboxyamino)imidazole ribonucleotide synthase [Chitinophagales bacterium]
MNPVTSGELQLGILGGGQLGKMLIEAASNWNISCHVLDPDPECACAHLAYSFTCGSFKDYETVYNFGKDLQKITIEIEHVNVEALFQLENEGKDIYPKPEVLKIIQDKGKQKLFYEDNDLPTANFQVIENKAELIELIHEKKILFPFVQKSCKAGYDGKGVSIIRSESDLDKLLDGECVIEDIIDFEKELAIIVARNKDGNTICFPPVEMEFHPEANLVEFLFAPAHINNSIEAKAETIAMDCISAFGMTGILAVEMFLTKDGEILINEVAPRAHNSGHHTIEANFTSQYEQLLRTIFDIPLGSTAMRGNAIMVNILGEDGFTGEAKYEGLKECLKEEGLYVHLYGKKITKPFRKMGHVTIIGEDESLMREKADMVKKKLKVIS